MVIFGPSGMSDSQIAQKVNFLDVPSDLKNNNLLTFEYPFTFGVNLSDEKASLYGEAFKKAGVSLSVHAPYYINYASPDDVQIQKSHEYILACVEKMKLLGSSRVVFHPGSLTKQDRGVAFSNIIKNIKELITIFDDKQIKDVYLCPETMGKHGQLGNVDEIYEICKLDRRIIPTLDFGHINSFYGGSLKSVEDFKLILDKFIIELGKKEIHIHFSKIQYGPNGELKHLTFEDNDFGPDYKLFAKALIGYDANIRVICESSGTQREDSIKLQQYFSDLF